MKVKVDIYSGFLGAGKTYLIKKLIKDSVYDKDIAIIENEFGEVSIDGAILRDSNIEVKEINSGCICCQVTGDFKEGILEVLEKFNPSKIIIEPSGVAKLTDIIDILKEKDMSQRLKVDNIITVVDPTKFYSYKENFKYFYEDQIKNAKKIVLSRTQKIDSKLCNEIKSEIQKMNPKGKVIIKPWAQLSSSEIIEDNKEDSIIKKGLKGSFSLRKENQEKKLAGEVFETYAIYPKNKISKNELISKFKFISSTNTYGDVLRAKGIVNFNDGSHGQFDFVKDEFVLRDIKTSTNNVISIIGVDLNKNELQNLFK